MAQPFGSGKPRPDAAVPMRASSTSAGSVLVAEGVKKRFGATHALRGADLTLKAGRVHALMGENGAGKSTLVKILAGALRRDDGFVALRGQSVNFSNVRDAVNAGVVPVYQQLTLFPHLSVLENLYVFKLADGHWYARKPAEATRANAETILAKVGLEIELDEPVSALSLGERQLLEIARGLGQDCSVLILDEPTAALTRREADRLFRTIGAVCESGVAVLYISHKIDEIEENADDVTVLRDGVTIMNAVPRAELSGAQIVSAMLGHSFSASAKNLPQPGPVVLRAENLSSLPAFGGVNLVVGKSEIVGIAGLIGSGAMELGAALAGARAVDVGSIKLDGRPLAPGDRANACRAGIGFIPPDRLSDGIFGGHTVAANASASVLGEIARSGFLSTAREGDRIFPWLNRLHAEPADYAASIGAMSGGNQQKVIAARNLALSTLKILVAMEPTRGIDIAAREELHANFVRLASTGVGIVLVSTDLEELLSLCHRILALRMGRIVAEFAHGIGQTDLLASLSGAAA